MIPKECKRLAEVDFPIAEVSRHAAREKEARCGHIPKIHIWPAARPIASSRAVLLALLWPDPCDPLCPPEFKRRARELLPRVQGTLGTGDVGLRKALFKFIADFANWDLAANRNYVQVSRALVRAAHGEEPPLVVDPFAGGGSIPLEALRLGCEAFASDLNPVACLILKVVLEDIPRHGQTIADELRRLGDETKRQVETDLSDLYPNDSDGATPVTYLWARTVRCESPNCGAEIPLMRSLWLCKKARRKWALRPSVVRPKGTTPHVEFEVFQPSNEKEVRTGTVTRAKATCICCAAVLPPDRVRAQLTAQHGGADAVFDAKRQRTGGARMLAVVLLKPGETGRRYRIATEDDYAAVSVAMSLLQQEAKTEWRAEKTMSFVPDERISLNELRRISVPLYGMQQWGELFTARQRLVLGRIASLISKQHDTTYATQFLALNFSKMVDMNNALATWQPHAEIPAHMFTRNAIPMKWDFAEAVPLSDSSGTLQSAIKRSTEPLGVLSVIDKPASVQRMDAASSTLPDQTASVWFTDPPYYDAVPYSYLSDFFYVWLRRALGGKPPDLFNTADTLKDAEIVVDRPHSASASKKDVAFYEAGMARAFAEGRRVLNDNGIGSVVFAHKTTEGWEALLSGMIRGGWTITASWPVATEMGSRLNARETASLATSVHLICRPRLEDAGVGDWAVVLRDLPARVGDWMERLQGEGVRGADLVFACIGPALEIFSRYMKVETADGREVALAEYLEKVWEVVGRSALAQVLGTAEAKARNGAAGAVEEDARLTALFLWTLQSTDGETSNDSNAQSKDEELSDEDDDEEGSTGGKVKGFTLVFDVVRRFAQPLGINLPKWEGRVIETKKGVVRLLPIAERAKQLFGEDGAQAVAARLELGVSVGTNPLQGMLFPESEAPKARGRSRGALGRVDISDASLAASREATTLDRVHAAMLLQSGGRTNALRALLKAEQERGPDFLRLGNAFSALYPKGSEEKRLIDAMLLALPR